MLSLGQWLYARRGLVLVLWAAAVLVALPFVPRVFRSLNAGGFDSPDLEAFRAAQLLKHGEADRLQQAWGKSAHARQTLEAMLELRENLRDAILSWERNGTRGRRLTDELNRLMAAHPMLNRLNTTRRIHGLELWFMRNQPEDLFAPLAYSAANLFAAADRHRVRKCEHCVLHFHDTSKKGTRRWCSMQLCGNRLKVAAYAARHRRASE